MDHLVLVCVNDTSVLVRCPRYPSHHSVDGTARPTFHAVKRSCFRRFTRVVARVSGERATVHDRRGAHRGGRLKGARTARRYRDTGDAWGSGGTGGGRGAALRGSAPAAAGAG